jgi:hypothetical protein
LKKIAAIMMSVLLLATVFSGCAKKESDKGTDENVKNVSMEEIHTAIKDAYGEFGLDEDLYDEIVAEQPMMSIHADRVLLVKAKEGKAEDVEKILNEARERKISDSLQYPMNLAKVAATKVVRNGNYVAFLLVGSINDAAEITEEEAKDFAETEVAKAVEAFNNLFK